MSQQPQQQTTNVAVDVVQQIGQKQPPNNQQISELIQKTQHFIEEKQTDPSVPPQSMKAMSDFQGVLEATEQLNLNKNQDELLQKTILDTGAAGHEVAQAGKQTMQDPTLQQKGTQVKEQGKQLTSAMWSVLRTMVQSSDFRAQVSSLISVFQEMFVGSEQQQSSQQQHQLTAQTGEMLMQAQQLQTPSSSQGHGLSEEKKREVAHHFLNVLRKLNSNKEFRSGFNNLLSIFQDLSQNSSSQQAPHQQVIQTVKQSEHVDQAFEDSKKLIERFSERPLDPFLVKNRELFEYVRQNEQAKTWLHQFIEFLRDAIEKPNMMD